MLIAEIGTNCESAALNMTANLENSAGATGLKKVSFHSNPKESPVCASSSPVFLMMYFAYKLNKQGDNIQP